MRNQLKVAALVAVIVVGMVLYKEHYERKEVEKKATEKKKPMSVKADKRRWN